MNIPDEAVEAAYASLGPDDTGFRYVNKARVRQLLEAAAPHLIAVTEWGIFRVTDDEAATPIENRRYRTREIAERHLRYDYAQPEFWEVRGRAVGEWVK